MKRFIIYGLYDSEDPKQVVRYVGQTRDRRGPQSRLYLHLWASRSDPTLPVHFWVREIGESRVKMRTLRESSESGLDHDEIEEISAQRVLGGADLNVLDGGKGVTSERVAGERNPNASLSPPIVRELRGRAMKEYVSPKEEAKRLGVQHAAISKILTNRSWHDPDYDPELRVKAEKGVLWRSHTDEEVDRLRAKYLSGMKSDALARNEGLSRTSLNRMLFEAYGSDTLREQCVRLREIRGYRPTRHLTPGEREDVVRLARSDLTQAEIARRFGITQSGVSYLVRQYGKLET